MTLNTSLYHPRFRNTPTFSPNIRKLPKKVSELSKLAARDYEDILQVHTPLHDSMIQVCVTSVTVCDSCV
jgi:hypothetical protein